MNAHVESRPYGVSIILGNSYPSSNPFFEIQDYRNSTRDFVKEKGVAWTKEFISVVRLKAHFQVSITDQRTIFILTDQQEPPDELRLLSFFYIPQDASIEKRVDKAIKIWQTTVERVNRTFYATLTGQRQMIIWHIGERTVKSDHRFSYH